MIKEKRKNNPLLAEPSENESIERLEEHHEVEEECESDYIPTKFSQITGKDLKCASLLPERRLAVYLRDLEFGRRGNHF